MSKRTYLEDEAYEIIRLYIWRDVEVWALEEGIGTADFNMRMAELRRLEEIGAFIGDDRVHAMWPEAWDDILPQVAEMARKVVPHDVVDDWVASRNATKPFVAPNGVTDEHPDPSDSPPSHTDSGESDLDKAVREGLGRVMRAILLRRPHECVK